MTPLESADKGDFYSRTLETERNIREQADKQILDLLHDVRTRYETKLNGYMAKNIDKKNEAEGKKNDKKSDKKSDKQSDKQTDKQAEGKKNDKKKDKSKDKSKDKEDNKNTSSGWGSEEKVDQPADSGWCNEGGWGDEPKKSPEENQKADSGWDTQDKGAESSWDTGNKNTESGWAEENKTTDAAWGTENQNTDSGWGNENKNTESDWGKENKATNSGWGSEKKVATPEKEQSTEKKTDSGWGNQSNKEKKGKGTSPGKVQTTPKQTSPGWNDDGASSSKKDKSNKDSKPEPKVATPDTNDYSKTDKDFADLRSKLWTTKLDLRLLERDKTKLTEEVETLRGDRAELIKKLSQATQEVDLLKVKSRGLTVDLVSANEEIHKLNSRIDELEELQKNRDNDVTMGESKRRAMENKFKSQQQQIVDLKSDLSLMKDERDDFRRRAEDLSRRNDRLEADLSHSKNLIRTLKDGCALVEGQAKTFEVRHDVVVMSKADLERELIAIKEESSTHITTINRLQQSNQSLSQALIESVESSETARKEFEKLQNEYSKRLQLYRDENTRLSDINNQLRKLIDETVVKKMAKRR